MIKIIAGIYGLRKNGRVVPITSKSAPISLAKAEEERLVKAGVAEYVDGKQEETKAAPTPAATPAATEKKIEDLSYNELKQKAAEMGLKVEGNKKQDFIDAINAAVENLEVETDDTPAPLFNAENTIVD